MPLRLPLLLVLLAVLVLPRAAQAEVDRLVDALDLPGVLAVMRAEGLAHAETLEEDMLGGRGGPGWQATVAEIYDPARLAATVRPVFAAALAGHDVAAMAAFFESPLGRRIVRSEITAREAFLDEGVEEAAKLRAAEMIAAQDRRIALIEDFIAAGDLVEANVAGGLNTSLAFWRGLRDGGFGGGPGGGELPEDEMLAQVWTQEPQIRAETETWLYAYLALSYEPLTDAELADYVAFARSPAGKVLNAALFAAFDAMFTDMSYRLGVAVARGSSGQEL